jgi:chromosome segregation ATPase
MLRKSLAESQVREAAMNEQIGSLTSQCDSARIEFDRVREESMIELSACRTDAAVRAEEAERRRVSELELARQNAQTEMETAQKAWEDRLARFESLLAQARSRMEELEAGNSALRRDLMTAHLMREDLSLKVVSQQARIDELADTLRKLYLNHELFTASVKSIVDP